MKKLMTKIITPVLFLTICFGAMEVSFSQDGGNGTVPLSFEDILQSKIKAFKNLLTGKMEKFESYEREEIERQMKNSDQEAPSAKSLYRCPIDLLRILFTRQELGPFLDDITFDPLKKLQFQHFIMTKLSAEDQLVGRSLVKCLLQRSILTNLTKIDHYNKEDLNEGILSHLWEIQDSQFATKGYLLGSFHYGFKKTELPVKSCIDSCTCVVGEILGGPGFSGLLNNLFLTGKKMFDKEFEKSWLDFWENPEEMKSQYGIDHLVEGYAKSKKKPLPVLSLEDNSQRVSIIESLPPLSKTEENLQKMDPTLLKLVKFNSYIGDYTLYIKGEKNNGVQLLVDDEKIMEGPKQKEEKIIIQNFFKTMVYDRNIDMAAKIDQMLKKGEKPFVVIGDKHLEGTPSTVVELLRQKGWLVKKIVD